MTGRPQAYAVIMAGGVGSRFWPLSTGDHPKQFLDLTGRGKSLLRQTFERLLPLFSPEHIMVLTNERYIPQVGAHLPELPTGNILAEPEMRNTAPAILLAANLIHRRNPNAVMAVMPSDHYIGKPEIFIRKMREALDYVQEHEVLITLGIQPNGPNTNYGYIQYDPQSAGSFKPVIRFTEKPDKETARDFINQGNYLWNAGIFVWRTGVIREAFERHQAEMFSLLEKIRYGQPEMVADLKFYFPQVQNISVDYAILEKAGNVRVLPVDMDWNDLGAWDAVYRQLAGEEGDNVVLKGDVVFENASGNLIYSDLPEKLIIDGMHGKLLVQTEDVQIILPLERAGEVKKWRERVKSTPQKAR